MVTKKHVTLVIIIIYSRIIIIYSRIIIMMANVNKDNMGIHYCVSCVGIILPWNDGQQTTNENIFVLYAC